MPERKQLNESRALCLLWVISILLFRLYEEIDIAFSGLFFRDGTWVWRDKISCYTGPLAISVGLSIVCITFHSFIKISREQGLLSRLLSLKGSGFEEKRNFAFAAIRLFRMHFAIAMLLIFIECFMIHTLMKFIFHRPRPLDTIVFGGKMDFALAWDLAGECVRDCSFVSSHAGMGFAFSFLALIVRDRLKAVVKVLGVFLGLGIGLLRVMEGRHYISDVIFSGMIVFTFLFIIERFTIAKI